MNRKDVIEENGLFYGMSWFRAFRNEYGFSWYGDNRTAVTFDFPLVTVTYLCALIGVATLISTLGIRGRGRWATTLRASYAVGIASIILVCLVGHDWLVGETEVKTRYLYRSDNYFRGRVGLRVALHGCNVTLEGYYSGVNGEGHVRYAESMSWRDYGREPETISPYLVRGLPHPVLTVLDFLSADGGGLRWGRGYHSAGYFGCALLWTAFAFWIISNVLLMSVVSYGAFMFVLTGVAMVLSCVVYHVCQPPHPLRVHFGDSLLTTSYGWCYWLVLASGVLTLILGTVLLLCDHVFHEKVADFFDLENLDEDDHQDFFQPERFQKSADGSGATLTLPFDAQLSRPRSFPKMPTPQDYRRFSLPQQPGQPQSLQMPRKPSIFLEPERRGSLMYLNATGGITNKGFEQERSVVKTNPLFTGTAPSGGGGSSSNDIREGAGASRVAEVRVEVEMGDGPTDSSFSSANSGYSNRKPSLATMREHRENHMNERHQQRQGPYVIGSAGEIVTCTTVVIEAPSDENDDDDNEHCVVDGVKMAAVPGADDGKREISEVTKGHDYGSDSAIASGAPSPTGSAPNSTCGECEDGH